MFGIGNPVALIPTKEQGRRNMSCKYLTNTLFADNRRASYSFLENYSKAAGERGGEDAREGGREAEGGGRVAQSVSILRHGPNMLHFLFLPFSLFLPPREERRKEGRKEGEFFTFQYVVIARGTRDTGRH